MAATLSLLVFGSGCALVSLVDTNGWLADYDQAEREIQSSGRNLLIFYKYGEGNRDKPVEDALASEEIEVRVEDFVRCRLFSGYEPDRRYVAQFGVDRAPALIVLRNDGTYHARTGLMSTGDVRAFLDSTNLPGTVPKYNPYIPYEGTFDWISSLEEAEAQAKTRDKPMLVLFTRWLSRDYAVMSKTLGKYEVYRRFADHVPCHLTVDPILGTNKQAMKRFGVTELPALVVVNPDGDHHTLELPLTPEKVVRWADQHARSRATSAASVSKSAEPPPDGKKVP